MGSVASPIKERSSLAIPDSEETKDIGPASEFQHEPPTKDRQQRRPNYAVEEAAHLERHLRHADARAEIARELLAGGDHADLHAHTRAVSARDESAVDLLYELNDHDPVRDWRPERHQDEMARVGEGDYRTRPELVAAIAEARGDIAAAEQEAADARHNIARWKELARRLEVSGYVAIIPETQGIGLDHDDLFTAADISAATAAASGEQEAQDASQRVATFRAALTRLDGRKWRRTAESINEVN